jgi:hypothetical protein
MTATRPKVGRLALLRLCTWPWSERAHDEAIRDARHDPGQHCELPDPADPDLLSVTLEAVDDRVGDGCGRNLRHVEAAHGPGIDDGRQHLEDANAARLQLLAERAGERVNGRFRPEKPGTAARATADEM